MRMSDWSSDVCSSDLESPEPRVRLEPVGLPDDRLGRPKQQRAVRRNCAVQPFEDLAPRVGRQIKQQVAAKADVETPRRRKSVVQGKSRSVRVDLGGCRHIKKQNTELTSESQHR